MSEFVYFWISHSSKPDAPVITPNDFKVYSTKSIPYFYKYMIFWNESRFKRRLRVAAASYCQAPQHFSRDRRAVNSGGDPCLLAIACKIWTFTLSKFLLQFCKFWPILSHTLNHVVSKTVVSSQIATAPPIWFSLSMIVEVRACVSVSYPQCRIFSLCPT